MTDEQNEIGGGATPVYQIQLLDRAGRVIKKFETSAQSKNAATSAAAKLMHWEAAAGYQLLHLAKKKIQNRVVYS